MTAARNAWVSMRELLGRGALEREDRLLRVADGEQGAARRAGAPADEELAGQGAKDVPLLGRGVLRLVEQDMVDAAVELVEHPGRIGFLGEQRMGAVDQVGEVQRAARVLLPVVKADIGQGEGEGVDGVLRHPRRDQATADLVQPFLLVLEPGAGGGIDGLGSEPGGRGAGGRGQHAPDVGEGRSLR